jgi:hypothetical protein
MRGKTVKKLRNFIKILIENTPEEQRNKSESQLYEEMKSLWYTQGQRGQKFIDFVIKGNIK